MIPVFRPTIKRKDMDIVLTCLVSDQIGPGSLVSEFEGEVAGYLGVYKAVAFTSYYMALRIAVRALELEKGTRVIVSALSPAIYQNILEEEGLVPLIVDVSPDTGILAGEDIENAMPEHPGAIIFHYTLGMLPEVEEIRKWELPVIEDISHCFGARAGEQRFGSFSDLTVLSLQQENIITTSAGGIVCATDKKYWPKLKAVKEYFKDELLLTNMNASLGLSQMKDVEGFLEKRKRIFAGYKQALMKSRHKAFMHQDEYEYAIYSFPVILSSGLKEVQKYCRKKNIETVQPYTHSIAAFNEEVEQRCVNAQKFLRRTLLLPLYPMLGKQNVNTISRVIGTLP